jgi:hypothetical protein
MDAQELRNLQEAYMEVYKDFIFENVSTGNSKRASFGGVSQRVSNSEIDKIKNNPYLLSKRKEDKEAAEKEKINARQEPIIRRKKELEDLSNQNPKGGISGEAKKLTRRNKDGRKGKETPRNRAKRKENNIETVPLHLRKTPEQHESGRKRLNILRALRDPHWGTPAANHDWRQERRSSRSKRLGLTKEEYDCLMHHILSEGYAETPEAAEAIMVNMSEEWRDSIIV